jgi:FKBP-type peptidyl-prolyl cis-trans isomerase
MKPGKLSLLLALGLLTAGVVAYWKYNNSETDTDLPEIEKQPVVQNPVKTEPKKPDTTQLAGEKFLKENAKRKGIKITESGLQYEVIKAGSGPKPNAGSNVKVHYHGTNIYGQVFDSSIDRGKPIEFSLNQVIPGWTEGLQLMSVGAKYRFYIPQELAYGPGSPTDEIPPYSCLIFDVQLLGFTK